MAQAAPHSLTSAVSGWQALPTFPLSYPVRWVPIQRSSPPRRSSRRDPSPAGPLCRPTPNGARPPARKRVLEFLQVNFVIRIIIMVSRRKMLLLHITLLFFFCVKVNAATFTVGVEDLEYYPLYTMKDGKYVGFSREVLDAFAVQHGYTFQYVSLPIKRLYSYFLTEQSLDFKYPDNPKWQTEMKKSREVTYSHPLVKVVEGLMVLPENKGRDLSQLKSVGTVLGFAPWPYLDLINRGQLRILENASFQGLLLQILKRQIDGVYINIIVADNILADVLKTPKGLVFDPNLPHTESNFNLSTVRHEKTIQKFNSFLLQEKALVNNLREKYKISDPNLQ
jgi:polar amino acid transport system substrate-binding protein